MLDVDVLVLPLVDVVVLVVPVVVVDVLDEVLLDEDVEDKEVTVDLSSTEPLLTFPYTNEWGFLGFPLFSQRLQCFCTLQQMC